MNAKLAAFSNHLCALSYAALFCAFSVLTATALDNSKTAKIAPQLIETTARGETVETMIILGGQTDLSPAASLRTKADKTRFVYQTLRKAADQSQAPLRKMLEARGVPYKSFYLINAIKVAADSKLLSELAGRDEVLRLEANPTVRTKVPAPTGVDPGPQSDSENPARHDTTGGPEWNITRVKAPSVWAMGYTGQGIVLASLDTGVKWDHPALKSHYRGWNGTTVNHNYNWHDATSDQSPTPIDPNSHGTFTTSEMVGDDGLGNQVGVAPGAKWIACRSMDLNGNGSPAQYLECFEYFLAPYPIGHPELANPALAPDAINNSWDCPKSEGCSPQTLSTIVSTIRAAGIFPVMAAGNTGPNCATITVPPAFYASSVSVGATDMYTNQIAMFSSRGPIKVDGSNRMKPELSAPGDYIRAAVPYNNGYQGYWQGTSMAAPHVTGGVALLWQAQPALQGNVDSTLAIMESTATATTATQNCGGSGANIPNNVYGYGMLNLLAATQSAMNMHPH